MQVYASKVVKSYMFNRISGNFVTFQYFEDRERYCVAFEALIRTVAQENFIEQRVLVLDMTKAICNTLESI